MLYPNYFATIGLPLVAGREFTTSDLAENSAAVCIVNEAFVRKMYPGENPLAKPCITNRRPTARDTSGPRYPTPPEPYHIIGVVKDSRYSNPRGEPQPVIYTT